jgi:TPR repeat protein
MFNLGFMHRDMDPPDFDAARYWWERAAALGHADAARKIIEELG